MSALGGLKTYFLALVIALLVLSLVSPVLLSRSVTDTLLALTDIVHILGALIIRGVLLTLDITNWLCYEGNCVTDVDVERLSAEIIFFFDSLINIFRTIATATFITPIDFIDGLNPIQPTPSGPGAEVGGIGGKLIDIML